MALSGLQIYKYLPKTNCKACGFPTCLAFAMQIAAKKLELSKCPHVSEEAKAVLDSASAPPIKLISIGTGTHKVEIGNETVMFRHEETFYHPTAIGFIIDDTMTQQSLDARISRINKLRFERVGQAIEANIIAIRNRSGNAQAFVKATEMVLSKTELALILMSDDIEALKEAASIARERRPLLYAATKENCQQMAGLAKAFALPLAASANTLDELSELVQSIVAMGVNDIILDPRAETLPARINALTQIRRLALKKTYRPFGYPTIAISSCDDPYQEVTEAATYIAKYAGIVLMKGIEPWQVLPLLTVRQNIYTDPQKPLQVEPRIYEIGSVNEKSPVLVTTNFSLTYYTVESEVESSRVPAYIIASYAEGLSVLTAWAAEKFTADTITKTLQESGIQDKVSHRDIIIPGYVAVLSSQLAESSGWKVHVGPKEASGLGSYLKSLKNVG